MVFTSFAFLSFFAVVLAGLWILRTRNLRHLLLLAASCYFYAYWNPVYLLLLLTPSLIDYWCALRIEEAGTSQAIRKRWLLFSLVSNFGLLGYFKYAGFFAANVARLFGWPPVDLHIL